MIQNSIINQANKRNELALVEVKLPLSQWHKNIFCSLAFRCGTTGKKI